MSEQVRRELSAPPGETFRTGHLLDREWLLTNGHGGYASAALNGAATRRYHGLLVAALPAPHGRVVMLTQLEEVARLPGGEALLLAGALRSDSPDNADTPTWITSVSLEMGLPIWRYQVRGFVFEKRIQLSYLQNTVRVRYTLVSGEGRIRLRLRPLSNFRYLETAVSDTLAQSYRFTAVDEGYELAGPPDLPPLRLAVITESAALVHDGPRRIPVRYPVEGMRGYDSEGSLYTFGYFRMDLDPGQSATLVASTESWDKVFALNPDEAFEAELERRRRLLAAAPPEARSGAAAELILAADQFIIQPRTRAADQARIQATGDEARTVIAGYHWFTDWGRDTMISLEGLTLMTGRQAEAGFVLRTFALHVRDGLIPNMFPEGERAGLYNTADASLWYFHAVARYLDASGDRRTLRHLLPFLQSIVDYHIEGTRFGIGIDPDDGLLRQGEEGYALTWMDAKVGDWVVTPRRGKAVEINALWYNALRLLQGWLREEGREDEAAKLEKHAQRACSSFNRRFWFDKGGYLYDVVDGPQGDVAQLRPNQILAVSLPNPVLDPSRWPAVVEAVRSRLLTPLGLRTLSPDDPDYKAQYYGDLRARDAAYHQGTVWAWLIGPFLDAWRKLHPGEDTRPFLEGFVPHLAEACLGTISEVFDAEPQFTARGCVAQAWSVAEVLRSWVLGARANGPDEGPG